MEDDQTKRRKLMRITSFENANYRFVKSRTGYHVQDKNTKQWLPIIISRAGCGRYQ